MFSYNDYDFENYIYVEEGRDGFIYGNYIDFPKFRQDYEEELLLNAGADIPFGEVIPIEEYIDIIYHLKHLVDSYIFDQLKDKVFGVDFSFDIESRVKVIDRDNNLADGLVNLIFDNYGVPDDYVYKNDLPDNFKYWYNHSDEQEYLDYINYPIELDEFDDQVKSDFDLINNQKDEIIRKSIILASLIFTESLLKSVIIRGLPNYDGISFFYREIISEKIEKDLKYNNSRNKLLKKTYGEKLPEQEWIDLRNSLEHDIGKASINSNTIKFYNMKYKKDYSYDINQLKSDLIEFGSNIRSIIYEN